MNGMGEESYSATESEASSTWEGISKSIFHPIEGSNKWIRQRRLILSVTSWSKILRLLLKKKIGQAFTLLH